MDFQKLLLKVGQDLGKDEVKALTFLCTDLLGRNLTSVQSASDLFTRLVDQDYLSAEKPQLLTELLLTIQRTRLVRELTLTNPATENLISPFRKLLYNLSEEITNDDLKDVKFLLNSKLPRRKLEENVTTLEVFLEMEHMDLLSDTNLTELEEIIRSVCPMLKEKINQFKSQPARQIRIITQETGRPRSNSYPFDPNQAPQPLHPERASSLEGQAAFQPLVERSLNDSNTSVDVVLCGDQSGALSHGMSTLSTETRRRVGSDSLQYQNNETFPKKQTFLTSDTTTEGLGTYPMTAEKRGICLIVNNYDFKTNLKKREGTLIDENCLEAVFKWMGFDVEIKRDCTSEEMLSVLQTLGSRDHSQMDCVVCCILSHGKEGQVYGVDGHTVRLTDLMEPLNGLKCRSLAEKPKLFFIQACQGTDEQRAVNIEADGSARNVVCSDAIEVKDSIPTDADFLKAMATVPYFVSFREKTNGTWFIQSLCKNLVEMVPRSHDLVSILTKVNADVSQKADYTGERKQMPQPAFSLRKRVVFPVPTAPPPNL